MAKRSKGRPVRKMAVEKPESKAEQAMDRRRGIKEGSARDERLDRLQAARKKK